jgi:diaminohydroxyphosphoribosylaminopyrimidine deaminase / 5-amino-6-(5-phosphoribosylamino)uracil reductase
MVGAVVVAGDEIVAEAYHARYGESHAEAAALQRAGDRARGATLYVTLEPCAHYGKTPPCADAVIDAGIARVVIAAPDPSPTARGGASRIRSAGIQVDFGVEERAALELNAPFFNSIVSHRPWITLKLAMSADGALADPTGAQRWITGVESRAEVHRLRANTDAIAVGVGTVIADDPSLTVRDAERPRLAPRRVVFDSSLRTPRTAVLVRTAREVETILVCSMNAPVDRVSMVREAGVQVLRAPSLHDALDALHQQGIRSLFVEGGGRLAGSLLRERLVDRLIIFRSQEQFGGGAPHAFAHAPPGFEASLEQQRVVAQRRFGTDDMTVYALREVPCSPG